MRSAGHDCEHVADVGLRDADDSPIWRHADAHGQVIVAKDEDFAVRKVLQP
jgi:predicted nuclease of predicted toxin-antitoxin system